MLAHLRDPSCPHHLTLTVAIGNCDTKVCLPSGGNSGGDIIFVSTRLAMPNLHVVAQ